MSVSIQCQDNPESIPAAHAPSSLRQALSSLSAQASDRSTFLKRARLFLEQLTNAEESAVFLWKNDTVKLVSGNTNNNSYNDQSILMWVEKTAKNCQVSHTIQDSATNRKLRIACITNNCDNVDRQYIVTQSLDETPFAAALAQERFDIATHLLAEISASHLPHDTNAERPLIDLILAQSTLKSCIAKLVDHFAQSTQSPLFTIAYVNNLVIHTPSMACSGDASRAHLTLIAGVMSEVLDNTQSYPHQSTLEPTTILARKLYETSNGLLQLGVTIDDQGDGVVMLYENPSPQILDAELDIIAKGLRGQGRRTWLNQCRDGIGRIPFLAKVPSSLRIPALLGTCTALLFVPVPKTLTGNAIIVPEQQQVIAAPFTSRLESVLVEPGDAIVAGETIIARLDVSDLIAERDALKSQYASHLTEWRTEKASGNASRARISQLRANEAKVRMELLDDRIVKSSITSPLSGIIQGINQKQNLGIQLRQGEELYRVVGNDNNRVEINFPAQQLANRTKEISSATLRLDAFPSVRQRVEIAEIYPLAEFVGARNIIKTIATVTGETDQSPKTLAGMSGTVRLNDGWQFLGVKILREPVRKLRIALGV